MSTVIFQCLMLVVCLSLFVHDSASLFVIGCLFVCLFVCFFISLFVCLSLGLRIVHHCLSLFISHCLLSASSIVCHCLSWFVFCDSVCLFGCHVLFSCCFFEIVAGQPTTNKQSHTSNRKQTDKQTDKH